ncbi:MAG: hypothetical protein ACOY3Y_02290 [Acidobacteriota bacterium]
MRGVSRFLGVAAVLAALGAANAAGAEGLRFDLEAGAVWQARNDFAVPGDGGTLVRLADRGPESAFRATLLWDLGPRWTLRVLAAPLRLSQDTVPAGEVSFEEATFPAAERIRVDYRFDSYRASLVRRFDDGDGLSYRLGATLKVRSAEIALAGSGARASKTDLGVVPLLYGGVRWQGKNGVAVDAEFDGLAAPQGRAVDASVRVEAPLGRGVRGFAGARVLDGGADNDDVFSFATFGYGFAGVRLSF